MPAPTIHHLIGGKKVTEAPCATRRANADPATGQPRSEAPLESLANAEAAVQSALDAFPAWSATPVGDRVQVLFRYKALLEAKAGELADIVVAEHGKTKAEALGSVRRGIDCVEFACGAPALLMGRSLPQIAVSTSFCRTEDQGGVGIDSVVDRVPLGVCVGITPFNFPVMVPLWMWPMAVACGNTFVLKPSEKVPLSATRAAELALDAGLPPGVLNVVHGGPRVVDALITHEQVSAVSFVGSTRAGEHIYKTATGAGKRAQCMCGAKNHSIVMPDANRDAAIEGLLGSAFGNAGQRCLAGSVAVAVGDAADWLVPALVKGAKAIRVGPGGDAGVGMGPLIDAEAKSRVERAIETAKHEGAEIVLDGRTHACPAGACFIGPSIIDRARPGMAVIEEEIFGPVLAIMRESTLDAAIATVNRSRYGNMSVLFT
ncbi:MAG: CoA-acylating methylmalonate-semialdehyde dehydrogenase, partial [Phycisphaerae bacterium]|nr:CoA-acylating methylmalonate-semialdehyde dehydrogenase [Phycisphaerae bacterium]